MPFNRIISRADAAALIQPEVSSEILKGISERNPVLSLARRLPNMATSQRRVPVMSALASAYFVAGDTGLKQTTNVGWENRFLDAEELACIVPIPQAVLDDAGYPIWDEVRPEVETALSVAVSQAVLFGTNIPASWTANLGGQAGIVTGANAAGHTVTAAGFADLYEAIFTESVAGAADGVLMLLEADGFIATGHIGHTGMRGRLRNMRDLTGGLLFNSSPQERSRYALDGEPLYVPTDGTMDPARAWMISGDWTQLVYAMRQDITFNIAQEAVITDAAGNIVYNLFQQDMVALRVVMRLGVALPNPINRENPDAGTRYPFAVLTA